jgi:ADP-ribose pyrophosphatase YjhB (NUDIX family)
MQANDTHSPAIWEDFEKFLPHISIDCCVFGFHENQLKILLIQWENFELWSLPGGFIFPDESVDAAAGRILQERTSLQDIFLEQFKIFGEVNRTNLPKDKKIVQASGLDPYVQSWLLQRTISLGYYALVDFSKALPTTAPMIKDCRWWNIEQVPPLINDHSAILMHARKALQLHLLNKPIGLNLLPKKFTMTELRRLYETILGKPIDRRNFEKKMLKLGIIDRLDEVKSEVTHKAPLLYQFNLTKYNQLLAADFGFGF